MKLTRLLQLLVVASLLLTAGGTPTQAVSVAKAQPQLLELASQAPDQMVRVIAQMTTDAQDAETLVAGLGGKVTQDLHIINAFAAEMTAEAALKLARTESVRWVSLDAPMEQSGRTTPPPPPATDNYYLDTLNVRQVWNMGLTGAGIGVAIVDSGISTDTDFNTNPKQMSFATNSVQTNDIYGHGTHVAGIVAGNGNDSSGKYKGIAPGVSLYSVKIADGTGMAYESDVVAGLQWIYNNKTTYNIRVVNLSLNTTTEQSYNVSPLDAAVEVLWFNGIVVVASAGNVDPNSTVRLYNASPANDPFIITVGAADEKGTSSYSDDVFATYTSFGISTDGSLKPNLFAPGSNIYSVLSKQSSWASQYPDRVTADGQYIRLSGTSMSAPMVTGAVALLLQDEPNLTPDQVKYRLLNTTSRQFCQKIGKTTYCLPYLDVYATVTGTTTASANTGTLPSQLLYSGTNPISWGSVGWNSVGWNSVGWNSVGWNSVGWNSVGWNSTFWGP